MRAFVACLMVLVWGGASSPVHAWGFDVHRFITTRALDGLPAEIKPFFQAQRAFITEHSVDPDLWRVLSLRGDLGAEDPNHFLNIDGLGEARPFRNVPRQMDAFRAKYGAAAERAGRLPWRTDEVFGMLVARLRQMGTGTPRYSADNAHYLSAVLAHYVEDAHVPFHAVLNHNGQLTNQHGIHSRFETELVLRHRDTLTLTAVTVRPFTNARDFIFDRLVESEALVETILAADRKAIQGRELYDTAYYRALLAGTRPIVERRVSEAASGVASAIVSAWIAAGRPALPAGRQAAPASIRR